MNLIDFKCEPGAPVPSADKVIISYGEDFVPLHNLCGNCRAFGLGSRDGTNWQYEAQESAIEFFVRSRTCHLCLTLLSQFNPSGARPTENLRGTVRFNARRRLVPGPPWDASKKIVQVEAFTRIFHGIGILSGPSRSNSSVHGQYPSAFNVSFGIVPRPTKTNGWGKLASTTRTAFPSRASSMRCCKSASRKICLPIPVSCLSVWSFGTPLLQSTAHEH